MHQIDIAGLAALKTEDEGAKGRSRRSPSCPLCGARAEAMA